MRLQREVPFGRGIEGENGFVIFVGNQKIGFSYDAHTKKNITFAKFFAIFRRMDCIL